MFTVRNSLEATRKYLPIQQGFVSLQFAAIRKRRQTTRKYLPIQQGFVSLRSGNAGRRHENTSQFSKGSCRYDPETPADDTKITPNSARVRVVTIWKRREATRKHLPIPQRFVSLQFAVIRESREATRKCLPIPQRFVSLQSAVIRKNREATRKCLKVCKDPYRSPAARLMIVLSVRIKPARAA